MINLIQPKFWYKKNIISYILYPFSIIYIVIINIRKFYYKIFPAKKFPIPIIIVGNITVGGTGKTPLVIYLAELLKKNGHSPGIISRGYGGKSKSYPLFVTDNSSVKNVGDEALLIARRTKCPVVVGPKKIDSARVLLLEKNCSVIISDDGLQHYALPRDIEIAVVDADLEFGNKFCLPAGPLREPAESLQRINFIVKNYNMCSKDDDYGMILEPILFYNLKNPEITKAIDAFKNKNIHAVTGIGNPKRFFKTLNKLGLNVFEHPFPDHYVFQQSDFLFKGETIIITEKDAVKCDKMFIENCWCLRIDARLSDKFAKLIINNI